MPNAVLIIFTRNVRIKGEGSLRFRTNNKDSRGGKVLLVERDGFHLENLQSVAPATSRLSVSGALHVARAVVQLSLSLVPLVVLPAEAFLAVLNTLL